MTRGFEWLVDVQPRISTRGVLDPSAILLAGEYAMQGLFLHRASVRHVRHYRLVQKIHSAGQGYDDVQAKRDFCIAK